MEDKIIEKLNNIVLEILNKAKNNQEITFNELKFLFIMKEKNKKYKKQKYKENLKELFNNGIKAISPLITTWLNF